MPGVCSLCHDQCRQRQQADPDAKDPYRLDFQHDRDRIIHTTAFRRLEYKTQVFVYSEGDHYRNRLTHSIEVAQIGRTWRAASAAMRTSPRLSACRTTLAIRRLAMWVRTRLTS